MNRAALLIALCVITTGCATSPPNDPGDICAIFRDKGGWYEEAADARKEWGSPISVMMAIMYQESRFVAKAKPPRKYILGFIPGPRPSSAYGYSQAKKTTWSDYKRNAGRYGADRDDFGDAIDFIGWYNFQSHKRNAISRKDAYRLYLAYHEGQGGYSRASYRKKSWLLQVAKKVEGRAQIYKTQLLRCEEELKDDGWFFGWF